MPLLRKKLFKEADRKSAGKNMLKDLKSQDTHLAEEINEDIDENINMDSKNGKK